MSNPAFKHLRKKQLAKRVKVYGVLVYVAFAIALASYLTFFVLYYARP